MKTKEKKTAIEKYYKKYGNYFRYYKDNIYLNSGFFGNEDDFLTAIQDISETFDNFKYLEKERYGNGCRAIWHKQHPFMSNNFAENKRDFNATCSNAEVKQTQDYFYKRVNMFGEKELRLNKYSGRISTIINPKNFSHV